jgi:hypothetical protein
MSGYDSDRKIVFTTLVIGSNYVEQSILLIQSIMKFTSSNIYVVTDVPEDYENHLNYFGSRLLVIDIKDYDNYVVLINGIFNYHLKCIAMYLVSKMVNESIVYVDCDTFLFGWDKSISRFINGHENSLFCRFREKVKENTSLAKFIPDKALAHGIDYTTIEARLAVETIMVLTRGNLTTKFMNVWKEIVDYSIVNQFNPFIEAFELAMAIEKCAMTTINVNNNTPFADNFRTLHNGKIISTNII